MAVTTRQLGCFPCVGCGANLLIYDQERRLTCKFCKTLNKAPKRLIDDLEHGRKLPFDATREMHQGLDRVIERRYQGFQLGSRWVVLAGVVGAVFFAWVRASASTSPSVVDYGVGALIGFFAMALPLGWSASWLETTGLGRAASRVDHALKSLDKSCPSCDHPIMGDNPGAFDCVMCKTSLIYTAHLVVEDSGPHIPLFEAAGDAALKDKSWLDQRRGTVLQYLGLVGILALVATSIYFAMTL
ncbi:MAG: hypothetical protein ACI9KE_006621 [Polyangiales bacterium]